MIIHTTGKIIDGLYVTGVAAAPVYLLDGPSPVLFDAGFSALAFMYEAGIKEILGDRQPKYLFLTHSHFDHIGAAAYLKKIWPDLTVCCSAKCRNILANPKAVAMMRDLSRTSLDVFKKMGGDLLNEAPFESFEPDITVIPEEPIRILPDVSIVPLATPGHTRAFLSYWIPERKILVASEAVAVYEPDGEIQTEFLVDADAYLNSLEKIKDLGATVVCAGHRAVFTDGDADAHIRKSVEVTHAYINTARGLLVQEKGDIDRVVSQIKIRDWDPRPWPKQTEPAYLINTRQRVKVVWEGMQNNST